MLFHGTVSLIFLICLNGTGLDLQSFCQKTFFSNSQGQVLYHSLSEISGFQFTIEFDEYCGDSSICPNIPESSSINSISGGIIGSLVESGYWTIFFDNQSGQVLGYSNNQDPIMAGCGLLMNIDFIGNIHDYINIYWSDEDAAEINILYYETNDLSNYIPGNFIGITTSHF